MEHYVGEEPKSEANCCSRKRALFTGESAEYESVEIHRSPKTTKKGDFFFKKTLVTGVFLLVFPAPPLSANVSHVCIRCLENFS